MFHRRRHSAEGIANPDEATPGGEAGPSRILDRQVDLSKELDAPSRRAGAGAATAGFLGVSSHHAAVVSKLNQSSSSSLARQAATGSGGLGGLAVDLAGPSEDGFVPLRMPGVQAASANRTGHKGGEPRPRKRQRVAALQVPVAVAAWEPDLFRSLGMGPASINLRPPPSAVSLTDTPEDATATYHRLYGKAAEHLRHFWPMQSKRALSPTSSQRLRKIVTSLRELQGEAKGLAEALPKTGGAGPESPLVGCAKHLRAMLGVGIGQYMAR